MPFQYLQQICQLYNYENKFVSEGPSFCFDHKLEGMVQRTPAAMFFEKWSSSQPTTSGVKKPKFSSNRDKDILSQLTVPNCKKMTATYAAPTIENRPFLETATLHIDDGQTILVLRCKYCAPLCDRQCNLKNMKLCYGFATEEAYKETRKSVLGEHARGILTAQITVYKTKLALAAGQSPASERGKIVGFGRSLKCSCFFLFQQPVSRVVSQRRS